MNRSMIPLRGWVCGALALLVLTACRPSQGQVAQAEPVRSHLAGRLTVNAEIDSTADYRGFAVIVAYDAGAGVDTLGYAVTDSTGAFEMDVTAPDRGIYPLLVSRRGVLIASGELAVADGDSATVQATLPVGNRPLRIHSPENGAWAAFRNTKAQHNNNLVELLKDGAYDEEAIRKSVMQTSLILWSMRETFPKTIGADLASAEAVMMLGGWDDSLAVARALEIGPDNASFADVARAARTAQSRLAGPEAAFELVRDFQARAQSDAQRAQLHVELILAYVENEQREEALAATRLLKDTFPGTEWAAWADRATYDLENLMPGMPAPAFSARTDDGQSVSLESLRGQVVVLEFYAPQNTAFARQLDERKALYESAQGRPFRLLSISLEPDTLLNEGFLEGRDFPGLRVIAPGGAQGELARRYNVNVVPTRYLIDPEGKLAGKYVGQTLPALQRDVLALLNDAG